MSAPASAYATRHSAAQDVERGIVEHIAAAGRFCQNAAVTVAGVFTDAYICNHGQLRGALLDCADRLRHRSVWIPSAAADRIFVRRNAEEQHRRYLEFSNLVDFKIELIDRQLGMTRHRADRAHNAAASGNEEWRNQMVDAERRFAHHATQRRCAA
jgi:hypothetical protein